MQTMRRSVNDRNYGSGPMRRFLVAIRTSMRKAMYAPVMNTIAATKSKAMVPAKPDPKNTLAKSVITTSAINTAEQPHIVIAAWMYRVLREIGRAHV